jgi:hypothetical protein
MAAETELQTPGRAVEARDPEVFAELLKQLMFRLKRRWNS